LTVLSAESSFDWTSSYKFLVFAERRTDSEAQKGRTFPQVHISFHLCRKSGTIANYEYYFQTNKDFGHTWPPNK
jgi:hypothetical protein